VPNVTEINYVKPLPKKEHIVKSELWTNHKEMLNDKPEDEDT